MWMRAMLVRRAWRERRAAMQTIRERALAKGTLRSLGCFAAARIGERRRRAAMQTIRERALAMGTLRSLGCFAAARIGERRCINALRVWKQWWTATDRGVAELKHSVAARRRTAALALQANARMRRARAAFERLAAERMTDVVSTAPADAAELVEAAGEKAKGKAAAMAAALTATTSDHAPAQAVVASWAALEAPASQEAQGALEALEGQGTLEAPGETLEEQGPLEADLADGTAQRMLARGWRRWRALRLVNKARELRLRAAEEIARTHRTRAGLAGLLTNSVNALVVMEEEIGFSSASKPRAKSNYRPPRTGLSMFA